MSDVITKEEIKKGLKELGLKEGDVVLVHSSLKSFGKKLKYGSDDLIDALIECVGKAGTVMMPTITGSEKFNKDNPPVFDVKNTPCWTGLVPETFRKRKGVKRSLHPTHSVAVFGKHADYLIKDHEISITPCGDETPYGRLVKLEGKVVFIGVTLECCTLFHACEEAAEVDYHMQKDFVNATIINEKGEKKTVRIKLHWYNRQAMRDFPKVEKEFEKKGIIRYSKIADSDIKMIFAKPAFDLTVQKLKENPDILLANGHVIADKSATNYD